MSRSPSSTARGRAAAAAPPELAAMRRRLLRWYRRGRRDLPWRQSRDPYRIWISEIMLQQTRVDVVVPYYERFVTRFPDVTSLATAPLDSVLRAWAGLGYYSRARNLHAAARQITSLHRGEFPRDPDAIAALPGIGRYTAGAIRSIAFDHPAAILDGNVVRVFARWFGLAGDVETAIARRTLWTWAGHWAAGPAPGDANQALMELGAVVCTKPVPQCARCPVSGTCNAQRTGRACALPTPRARAAPDRVHLEAGLVSCRGRLLVVRRRSGRLLQDWWELPTCGRTNAHPRAAAPTLPGLLGAPPASRLARTLLARLGYAVDAPRLLRTVRHSILNHQIEVGLWAATATTGTEPRRHGGGTTRAAAAPGAGATPLANLELADLDTRWVRAAECRALPLSTLTRKALRAAAQHDPRWSHFLPTHDTRSASAGD